MKKLVILIVSCTLLAGAQEMPPGHQHPAPPERSQPKKEQPPMKHDEMSGMAGMDMTTASPSFSSGTSWLPASSPMHGLMYNARNWDLSLHGEIFGALDHEGGPSGKWKAESMNWAMLMESRKLGRSSITFRQMISIEPFTAPHGGFPELFQTGETYRNRPIVDHQHPHDLFDELSVLLKVPITEKFSWLFYGGVVGEPALGPTSFPHRISAEELPTAPLSHHLQDSTHIAPGVITTGFIYDKLKFDGSIFNGREPDQDRATIDFAPLDSWSGRITLAPTKNWVGQYSYGFLRKPEAAEPGNINRQTAAIAYNRPITRGNWATSLIWGRNRKTAERTTQNSYLLESTLNFAQRNYGFTRLELLDRDELFSGTVPVPQFRIGAYTFGGARDIMQNEFFQLAAGADVTLYTKPVALDPVYGRRPISFQMFLRLRPGKMANGH